LIYEFRHAFAVHRLTGQGLFRISVASLNSVCRITGVSDPRFLRASHIKPWVDSTNNERIDGSNGLMLAPHADHLFDRGFISFSDDGCLLISNCFPASIMDSLSIPKSITPRTLTPKQASYMKYHREHIFQR